MAFLGEEECQQEERQHQQQNGVDYPGQAFKQAMRGPYFEPPVKVLPVAHVQGTIGKKGGVRGISEGDIDSAHHQHKIGFIGRHIQVINPGDLLIVAWVVCVRAFRLNLLAVGEDIHAGTG